MPFIKGENKKDSKIKFKLPELDLLKMPSKKEREGSEKNERQQEIQRQILKEEAEQRSKEEELRNKEKMAGG